MGGGGNSIVRFAEDPLTVFGVNKGASLTQNLLDPGGLRQFAMPILPKSWQAIDQDPVSPQPTVPGTVTATAPANVQSPNMQTRKALVLSGYGSSSDLYPAPGLDK